MNRSELKTHYSSLKPHYSLLITLFFLIAACTPAAEPTATPPATETPTLVPTITSSPVPTVQEIPTDTPSPSLEPSITPIPITIAPLLGEEIPPPMDIELPEDWMYAHNTLVISDIDALRSVPFALYTGPVTGGTGFIIMLWGFPNIASGNPLMPGGGEADLLVDGLRLLHFAIIEPGCNPGTDLRREYSIGGLPAVGTLFAAVDCAEEPDTKGWFAGLQESNLNFVFYVYAYPIEAMDGPAPGEMQSILDTVRFRVPTPENSEE